MADASDDFLSLEGILIEHTPKGESYELLKFISRENGLFSALWRSSGKKQKERLDLFDWGHWHFNHSKKGDTWFLQEHSKEQPYFNLSKHYKNLLAATDWCHFLGKNLAFCEWDDLFYETLTAALKALSEGTDANVVLLKCYYSFARTEGYPVKEAWLQGLPAETRKRARYYLTTPLRQLQIDSAHASEILENLKMWLKGYTELIIR